MSTVRKTAQKMGIGATRIQLNSEHVNVEAGKQVHRANKRAEDAILRAEKSEQEAREARFGEDACPSDGAGEAGRSRTSP